MKCPLTLTRALLCAALLPATSAQAATSFYGFASADNRDVFNRLEETQTNTTSTPASYTATAGANAAGVTLDAASGGSITSYATAVSYRISPDYYVLGSAGTLASITYTPTLVGPASPGLLVPVHVQASGWVEGALGGDGQATFLFSYYGSYYSDGKVNLIGNALIRPGGTAVHSQSFVIDQIVWLAPGLPMLVQLRSEARSSGSTSFGTTSWSRSFVDPTFSIADPALAELYHFEGIPSLAPVPEPDQWALLLVGLGLVLGWQRRGGFTQIQGAGPRGVQAGT